MAQMRQKDAAQSLYIPLTLKKEKETMAQIAFFELEKFGLGHLKHYLRARLKNHHVDFFEEPLTEKTADCAKTAEIIAIFVYSKINNSLLKKLPKLKMLTTMSTGFEHIDLAAIKKLKLIACNVPAYGENTVAEHAMALLLALSRKLILSTDRTRKGNFQIDKLRGFDLKGKTLGILGSGNIGRHMARYARAFDMQVLAYDSYPNKTLAKEIGFTYVPFKKLLTQSDVISIHLPETPQTHHLINTKNISTIKKGCILINTARGGIVQTDALILGLKKGYLAGAGLDVLEEEKDLIDETHLDLKRAHNYKTLLENHVLLTMENVIITPHNAFNSNEALQRIVDTTLENINSFIDGKAKNVIH